MHTFTCTVTVFQKQRHRSIISNDDVLLTMLSAFYVIHICIRGKRQLTGYYVNNN